MKKTLKKAVSIFVSLLLITSGFTFAFADEGVEVPEKIKGDINGNGVIDINDVTLMQKYLAFALSDEEEALSDFSDADMDGNGTLDVNDATYMQGIIANIDLEKPSEETTESTEATEETGESTEVTTDPTEATEETAESTEATTDPTEPTEETAESTEATTDPTEATEETAESTEVTTDPTESTEETAESTEATTDPTEPTEETAESTEPTETTEEPTEPTEETTEPTEEPDDEGYYILPESNTRLLDISDLEGLSYAELELARNEIYARHGRLFDTDYIQEYFNNQSWYNGTIKPEDFDYSVISDIELANVWFIYDYEHRDYILPESDKQLLTLSDIENLSAAELELARNEIYARHGRLFDTDYIQEYFNSKSWYNGTIKPEDFDYSIINEVELANVWFIYDYEHAVYGNITEENLIAIS